MRTSFLFKSLLAATMFCGCLILCQCNGTPSSSTSSDEESTENAKPEKEQLCGGYTEQGDISEEDLAIFNKVMSSLGEEMTYTPISVSTQVVAGLNYRFYCSYADGSQEEPAFCYVIIYQPLDGEPELTEIQKI